MAGVVCSWDFEIMLTHLPLYLAAKYENETNSVALSFKQRFRELFKGHAGDSNQPSPSPSPSSSSSSSSFSSSSSSSSRSPPAASGKPPVVNRPQLQPPPSPLAPAAPLPTASTSDRTASRSGNIHEDVCQILMYMLLLESFGDRYQRVIQREDYQRLRAHCEAVWKMTNCNPSSSKVQLQVCTCVGARLPEIWSCTGSRRISDLSLHRYGILNASAIDTNGCPMNAASSGGSL